VVRADVDADVLLDLFGGLVSAALGLKGERGVGLEDAAALVTTTFLRGVSA
jgi:hypothetical protein